jgi:hypothetical protein
MIVYVLFRSIKLLNIERLLWIAEMYVLNVEETHVSPRTILPHGASFQGFQINLFISCETPKQEFMLVVSYFHLKYKYKKNIKNENLNKQT